MQETESSISPAAAAIPQPRARVTDEDKASVRAWIDAQDGHRQYVGKLDNSEGALNLDGWFNLYDLAASVRTAERERCAKIAEAAMCHSSITPNDIAAKIRSGE